MLEYLPSTSRATIIIIIELFWSLGSIFEYLTAMYVVPAYGWRLLTGLSALPISIVAMCMYVSIINEILMKWIVFYDLISSYRNHHDILWQLVGKKKLNIF